MAAICLRLNELMNSFDIDYNFNDNKNLGQYGRNTISSQIMPCYSLSCKFDESKWNPYWANMLTSPSGTNYVLNEHGDVGQYAILSEVMPCYSYPASLVNQFEILSDSSCSWAHLTVIMSLMSMEMLTNMTSMQYRLR